MNKLTYKHISAVVITSFCNSILWAQDTLIKRDSSNLDVTYFKDNFQDNYSGDDFNYSINDTGGINLVQRVLRKFFNWLGDIFGFDIDFIDYKTLEYIIYGLLGIIVLYLLIKFLLQNPVSSVFKTEDKDIEGFSYVEEDIKQVDFDKLIKKALKENNYRLATRYMYLKSLKVLANKKIIEWHYEKTNSDYLNEIKNSDTKNLFKRVSYIYDYVWYGEFPIDETKFIKNKEDFNALIKSSVRG
ncbi:MAG: hypothetical protein CL868_00100 [Cytophagaceae bacterium]|nr:hypothetical protein [Flavobacteriaceae bacterium]MAZ25471.1 hypothetical protein [Cytophagaceae bacterium]|tara:strand:+ start:261 stop:989 length:729 start_codon:yes stop_codon:yes gene_type:complete